MHIILIGRRYCFALPFNIRPHTPTQTNTYAQFSSHVNKKNAKSQWMDSGKTFYILSKIRTTFPCVFCSAAPSSGRVEEAWAALWSVVWVTVQQLSNCGWWGKGTTLADRQRPMQGRWCHAMATTTPRLRVYMKSVVIQSPWKPKPGKKEAWRNRRPASVWPEPLVNLTLKKWANLNSIKPNNQVGSKIQS